VVGAGYAVSEPVGNAAVIVKLFRVFLLLPVVLGIGWWLAAADAALRVKRHDYSKRDRAEDSLHNGCLCQRCSAEQTGDYTTRQ
jgi:Conserved hypothetical protein 698